MYTRRVDFTTLVFKFSVYLSLYRLIINIKPQVIKNNRPVIRPPTSTRIGTQMFSDKSSEGREKQTPRLLIFSKTHLTRSRGSHTSVVQNMLVCMRSRSRIDLLWRKSHGSRLYTYQTNLVDRRLICNNWCKSSIS